MSPLIFPRQIIRIFPSLLFFFSSVDRLFFFSKYFPPLPSHLEKRYFPSLKYFLPSPYLFFFCPANQLFSWVQIFPSFPSPFSLFSTKNKNYFSKCCISISINRKFALFTWSSFRKDPFFSNLCPFSALFGEHFSEHSDGWGGGNFFRQKYFCKAGGALRAEIAWLSLNFIL